MNAPQAKLGYFPGVGALTDDLVRIFSECDALLLDGTFWHEEELIATQKDGLRIGKTATEMGHLPVQESLRRLASLRCPRKIFIHINNTNPILDEDSPERAQVEKSAWTVGADGLGFEI